LPGCSLALPWKIVWKLVITDDHERLPRGDDQALVITNDTERVSAARRLLLDPVR
jgi:hypothetical protein